MTKIKSRLIARLKHHETKRPKQIFFSLDEETVTYADFAAAVHALTDTLCGTPGIGVAIQADDPQRELLEFFACLAAGMRPVVCHADMDKVTMSDLCRRGGLISFSDLSAGITPPSSSSSLIPAAANFGVLSSGTTGTPKLFWRKERSWLDYFPIQNRIFHIHEKSRLFFHGSLSFTGNMNSCLAVFWEGGSIHTSRYYSPKTWLNLSRKLAVNLLYLLPVKLRPFTRLARQHPLPALQTVFAGSQVLDQELALGIQSAFPAAEFYLYYGASELNYISYCTLSQWRKSPGTVGRPFPGVHVRIENDQIFVTTPYGVIGTERETSLGDTGRWTEDGQILFTGRKNSVINCAGRKISTTRLEDRLRQHPAIADIAVFAVPDPLRGEIPAAAIVPADNSTAADWRRAALALLPIERPRYWLSYPLLPVNRCSKIDIPRLLHDWRNRYGKRNQKK